MADIPSYDQWMKDTHSLTSPRSEFLKKLDDTIKTQNRDTIKTALDRWRFEQSKQGKGWRKSVRNGKAAASRSSCLLLQAPSAAGVDKAGADCTSCEVVNPVLSIKVVTASYLVVYHFE